MSKLEKIFNFVKRTNDKAVVFYGDDGFVIMKLDDYSCLFEENNKVKNLSESDMLSKINREIALWRESRDREKMTVDNNFFGRPNGCLDYDLPGEAMYDDVRFGSEDKIQTQKDVGGFGFSEDSKFNGNNSNNNDYYDDYYYKSRGERSKIINSKMNNSEDISFSDKKVDDFVDNFNEDDSFIDEDDFDELCEEEERNINNFGYRNPADTEFIEKDKESENSSNISKNININEDNNQYNIPPPPPSIGKRDINKE